MLPEELRLITGTDHYFAGSDGFIYSFNDTRGHHPRRLKGAMDRHGYRFVNLRRFGAMKCRKVHALVCEAFHGEKPDPTLVTRHLDGIRDNNVPENLCWGTAKDNSADTIKHGTALSGERSPVVKLTEKQVRSILARSAAGERGAVLAAEFGVTSGNIYHIVHGRSWVAVRREVEP